MHRRSVAPRWLALATSLVTVLALAGSAVPAMAGNTRLVTVGSGVDGQLPSVKVSAGEEIIFPLTVRNTGRQTLNNVMLALGRDDWSEPESPPATVVPQPPSGLPDEVTISDKDTGGGRCSGGAKLTCTIGTLAGRTSFVILVTITATKDALEEMIPIKAVVTVAEIGNDHGSNADTFAAEGSLDLLEFSCNSISAYRTHGQSNIVKTCDVTDPDNDNSQFASVTLPGNLTTISLDDNVADVCPAQLDTCYSNAAVEADITGDEPGQTVKWILEVVLPAGTNVNLTRIVVYHQGDDPTDVTLIPLTKKNACKTDIQKDCGAAEIDVIDGVEILRVTIQTPGNGKVQW